MGLIREDVASNIDIHIARNRKAMGERAGRDIAAELRLRLSIQAHVRIIFAAAPSQWEMLNVLRTEQAIDWSRVTAFHMDEYVGLDPAAPQHFGRWLKDALFDHLPFGTVRLLKPGKSPEVAAKAYAQLLAEAPIDIVCLGIGANGHLAFNDPPANLQDPLDVRVVRLDQVCRQQQVDEHCFDRLELVPHEAVTLTVPRLLRAERLFCVVPGALKRPAVTRALTGPINGDCPASALRLHENCALYLDPDSARDLV